MLNYLVIIPLILSGFLDLDTALRLTPRDSNGVLLCDSRFTDRNNYTYDDSVGEPVAMLKFPSQKHVRLLTPGEMHPQVFLW